MILLGTQSPPGLEALIVWVSACGPTGATKPVGVALPYRWVTRPAGTDDKVTDSSMYSVHTFATSFTEADTEAQLTHSRILAYGPPLCPQRRVTVSGGRVVYPDRVETELVPHYEPYENETVFRFIARYRIDHRFVRSA